MIYKRRFIIVFLLFSFLFLQSYAWPWDSPEVKARKLVRKLEEYTAEVDSFDELTGLGWNPAFRKLMKDIKESGDAIVPILIEETFDTTNTNVFRYTCESSLIYIEDINKESANRIIKALFKILNDINEEKVLRNAAADALSTLGKQSTEFEGRRTEWAHWVTLLTHDKRSEIVDNLLAVSLDKEEGTSEGSVRWRAIRALATYDDYADIIIDSLSKYLDSPYSHIRAITVNAIGGLGIREKKGRISNLLVQELKKGKRDLGGEQVIYWIKILKVKEAIPLFLKTLETGKYCPKAKAARILGEWKVEEAVPDLIEILQTGKGFEKYIAADALGKIGARKAVEPLIEILGKDPGVTDKAAEALGKIGDPKAIKPIMEIFKNAEKYQVSASEEIPMALMALGATEAIPLIEERYKELQEKYPNSQVWKWINKDLQKLKRGEKVEYYEEEE